MADREAEARGVVAAALKAAHDARSREIARDELRADVALMRELGVARWGEIYLGPPPMPRIEDMTPEQREGHLAELRERQERARHEVLFAATSVRPDFPRRAPAPESVVQRSRPPERDDGHRKPA